MQSQSEFFLSKFLFLGCFNRTVRTSDRSGFDRPSSWGAPMGRPDHWSRPHTSPATRHYDDKTPFLSHTAPIGRNFDEDERKPLDGGSAPRRTVSDESTRAPPPSRVEVKPEYGLGGSSLGRQVAPVSPAAVGTVNSYSARLTEAVHGGMNTHSLGGSKERGAATAGGGGGGYPNVWSMRKEVANAVEAEQSARSGANAVSKLAHASALEKVSSGRWQSKAAHYQNDAELVRSPEAESRQRANVNVNNAYNRMDAVGEKEYYDAMLARQAERGLGIDNQMQGGRNELLDYEKSGVSKYPEVRPRSVPYQSDGVQPARNVGKLVGSELKNPVPSEPTERPKLNLLPRKKPLESSEPSVTEYPQVLTCSFYETPFFRSFLFFFAEGWRYSYICFMSSLIFCCRDIVWVMILAMLKLLIRHMAMPTLSSLYQLELRVERS